MFGTDGIRGRAYEGYITETFAYWLGKCVCEALLVHPGLVVIGMDTRESSLSLANALVKGIEESGSTVENLGVVPTPAVATEVKARSADLGVVLTASHNPYEYNGFKFFGSSGLKLTTQEEHRIEVAVGREEVKGNSKLTQTESLPVARADHYFNLLQSQVRAIDRTDFKAVIDCANGSLSSMAPELLGCLFKNLSVIGAEPDGRNINEDCGSTSLKALKQKTIDSGADFGIAFDGDGDRVLFVDEAGHTVDGDQVLFLLAKHDSAIRESLKGVVGTYMTNGALEHKLNEMHVGFCRTPIGDRFVHSELVKRGWILGGESSGHVIRRHLSETGDGLLTALGVIQVMKQTDQSLAELLSDFEMYPQVLLNVEVNDSSRLLNEPKVQQLMEQTQRELEPHGRLLVRESGTEPVVRVMVESSSFDVAERSARQIECALLESVH